MITYNIELFEWSGLNNRQGTVNFHDLNYRAEDAPFDRVSDVSDFSPRFTFKVKGLLEEIIFKGANQPQYDNGTDTLKFLSKCGKYEIFVLNYQHKLL